MCWSVHSDTRNVDLSDDRRKADRHVGPEIRDKLRELAPSPLGQREAEAVESKPRAGEAGPGA